MPTCCIQLRRGEFNYFWFTSTIFCWRKAVNYTLSMQTKKCVWVTVSNTRLDWIGCNCLNALSEIFLTAKRFEHKTNYFVNEQSDVFRPFGRLVYRFGRPNFGANKTLFKFSFFKLWHQKTLFKFSFSSWSSNQWFHSAFNYFEMA